MRTLILSGLVAMTMVGCGGGSKEAPAPAPAPEAPKPEVVAEAPANSDSTGVAECDDYLAKYTACIEQHVPEAMRATFLQSMEQTAAAWRQAQATTPEAKQALATACTAATDAAKQAMAAYSCSW